MGGGDDADDVTTELLEPAGRTADAASAMMDAVAKASADEAEGPAAVALPAAALSAAVAAATAAGTVGDSEEPDAGPLSQPLVSPPQAWRLQWASNCCSSQGCLPANGLHECSLPKLMDRLHKSIMQSDHASHLTDDFQASSGAVIRRQGHASKSRSWLAGNPCDVGRGGWLCRRRG